MYSDAHCLNFFDKLLAKLFCNLLKSVARMPEGVISLLLAGIQQLTIRVAGRKGITYRNPNRNYSHEQICTTKSNWSEKENKIYLCVFFYLQVHELKKSITTIP